MTERHLLITVSCGDERCGFCVHRSAPDRFCVLFGQALGFEDVRNPATLVRCGECREAERKAGGKP
jgi:hypothetical protein